MLTTGTWDIWVVSAKDFHAGKYLEETIWCKDNKLIIYLYIYLEGVCWFSQVNQ